jgi:6-pyruvoyltetrahydropterin/6-carboxytetrahydropterin synthase
LPGLENATSEVLCGWLWRRFAPALPGLAAITVHETCTARCTCRGV